MTNEEIRARLYAASRDVLGYTVEDAKSHLHGPMPDRGDVARSNRLLAAHLEITKPLSEAADDLAGALEGIIRQWQPDCDCIGMDDGLFTASQKALARYRAVKGAAT